MFGGSCFGSGGVVRIRPPELFSWHNSLPHSTLSIFLYFNYICNNGLWHVSGHN